VLVLGYATVLEGELHWRAPVGPGETSASLQSSPEGVPWKPWNPEAIAAARAEAARCSWILRLSGVLRATECETSLGKPSRARKTQADPYPAAARRLHLFPDNITAELNRFSRAGVPLVLIYPANPNEPPIVLPEALTPGMVVSALSRAAMVTAASAREAALPK